MARTATARTVVPLTLAEAQSLWTDAGRWATFVEGFAQVVEASPDWPEPDARLVWRSTPGGRGQVTERVQRNAPGLFATSVYEDALHGTQTATFRSGDDGATVVELTLEYELAGNNPLRAIADAIFIRRAQRDALARTLRRFRVEAEEDASLR